MASDFNKPLVTDTYSTLVPALQTAHVDILRWLEPTLTGTHTNLPTGAIRLNAATNTIEKYNGTTWGALTFTVGSGTATTALVTSLGASGNISSSTRVDAPFFYDSDNTVYYANPAGVSNFSGLTVGSTITGSISGNAGTVTNGIYTTNIGTYAPTLTGTGASGTWGINVTGNAGTATNLSGSGGNYIVSATSGTAYSSGIQVREKGLAGAQGSAMTAAPMLAFHWSGIVASSIMMEPSGRLAIYNNPGTAYEAFVCAALTATTGSFSSTLSASNFSGSHSGTSSGTNTGDQTNIGGNAATADRTNSVNTTPTGSHPGTGVRAFYQWGGTNNSGNAPNDTTAYCTGISIGSHPSDPNYGFQIVQNMWDGNVWTRNYASGYGSYRLQLDSANYNGYTPTLTGTGASGTWGINITGNAGTATNVAGLVANGYTTYGNTASTTALNGYYGYLMGSSTSHLQIMADGSGNGGFYRQASGWPLYYLVANGSVGIMSSTTSASYALYVTGAIYSTGNITAYSDERAKKNVVKIDNALSKVMQMQGVYYNKIDDTDTKDIRNRGKRQLGFIAQKLLPILPEAVTYDYDNDKYGVHYANIVAILTEAIKEQQILIEELYAKLS